MPMRFSALFPLGLCWLALCGPAVASDTSARFVPVLIIAGTATHGAQTITLAPVYGLPACKEAVYKWWLSNQPAVVGQKLKMDCRPNN